MTSLFSPEPFLFPSLSGAVVDLIRMAYGVLLCATLVAALPHARRYFLSERWGGYAQSTAAVDAVQNPVCLPALMVAWFAAAVALVIGVGVVVAALINFLLCRYFFVQMRWRSVLRGMGAPGFMAYWLGAAVLLLECSRRFAPELQGLALFVLQIDFAFIMLSAGAYKFSAGYRTNNGMELGMINPEWGYWSAFWRRRSPESPWFRIFNQLAWSTEVAAALLMLYPPTRFLGGILILVSFIFIATQIRLGWLCEMVIVCCLLFAHPGSVIDGWATAWVGESHVGAAASPLPVLNPVLSAALWMYLGLLPLARAGLAYNFHQKKPLPGVVQAWLDRYANVFGLIIWRVFSADITNFFIRICEQRADGSRRLISRWGESLRFRQVAESITVTSLFTTLKYYPSNNALFTDRLLRYSRTLPRTSGNTLVFEYISVLKRDGRFAFVPAAEYIVDPERATVDERVLDRTLPVRAPAAGSPIHEGARPGSYAPASR